MYLTTIKKKKVSCVIRFTSSLNTVAIFLKITIYIPPKNHLVSRHLNSSSPGTPSQRLVWTSPTVSEHSPTSHCSHLVTENAGMASSGDMVTAQSKADPGPAYRTVTQTHASHTPDVGSLLACHSVLTPVQGYLRITRRHNPGQNRSRRITGGVLWQTLPHVRLGRASTTGQPESVSGQ